jgi:hypothetical protein
VFQWLDRLPGFAPTEARLIRQVLATLRRRGITGVTVDPVELQLRTQDWTWNLGNLYLDWRRAPRSERSGRVERWVDALLQTPTLDLDPAEALPRLRAVVRSLDMFQHMQSAEDQPVLWPLVEDVAIGIVIDYPDATHYLMQSMLPKLELTADEARTRGLAQLRDATPPRPTDFGDGIWGSDLGDSYDASRVLLTDWLQRTDITGPPVIMFPDRGALMLCGRHDQSAQRRLLVLSRQRLGEEAHTISPRLWTLDEADQLVVFEPADTELRQFAVRIEREDRLNAYGRQVQGLQRRLGDDIYVALISPGSIPSAGGETSYAVWSEGVPTLLPRAEVVVLVEQGGAQTIVSWAALLAHAGERLTLTEHQPPRWSTGDFPDGTLLATLKSIALAHPRDHGAEAAEP